MRRNFKNEITSHRLKMDKKNSTIIGMKALLQSFELSTAHMFLLAILSRVLFAVLAVMISLKDERGNEVSPLVEVRFGDYGFYNDFVLEIFSILQAPFLFFYHGGSVGVWIAQDPIPGPFFLGY